MRNEDIAGSDAWKSPTIQRKAQGALRLMVGCFPASVAHRSLD